MWELVRLLLWILDLLPVVRLIMDSGSVACGKIIIGIASLTIWIRIGSVTSSAY